MTAIVSLCWAPKRGEAPCLARVTWSNASGEWRSKCPSCGATGVAAVGERNALDARVVGLNEPLTGATSFP
jgi:hypothetical protein